MRSVCCDFPAWPKLQHMWSCAWLASTGTGDDAGGGLGEGCSADADLPEDGSHQIHAANLGPWPYSCFPQYITLVHRDALVPYSGGPEFLDADCTDGVAGVDGTPMIQKALQHLSSRSLHLSDAAMHVSIFYTSSLRACKRTGIGKSARPISFARGEAHDAASSKRHRDTCSYAQSC